MTGHRLSTGGLERGVRALAIFEAVKGLLVLAAGFGLLSAVGRDAQEAAESFVRHFHLNPAHHFPQIFIRAAGRLSDKQLLLLALGAFVYTAFRLVEAYGLWHVRPWAEWVAIVSAGLYMPVELVELVRHPTRMRAFILVSNALIVAFLLYVRLRERKEHRATTGSA